MTEKRFTIHELVHYDEEQEKWVDCDRYCITDNETHINYDLKFNERQLCDLLNEQQATIRKLQDLCGESDGENAKLRIENKKLKEENKQLRQSKEILQQEISDTQKILEMLSEKLKGWNDE